MTSEDAQQKHSIELMQQHSEALAAEARTVLAEHPDLKLVGMILSPDSSEAAHFRKAIEKEGQSAPADTGIVVVVLRHFALSILRANAPATLDWLESEAGKLPLIVATKDGMRLGAVDI